MDPEVKKYFFAEVARLADSKELVSAEIKSDSHGIVEVRMVFDLVALEPNKKRKHQHNLWQK